MALGCQFESMAKLVRVGAFGSAVVGGYMQLTSNLPLQQKCSSSEQAPHSVIMCKSLTKCEKNDTGFKCH